MQKIVLILGLFLASCGPAFDVDPVIVDADLVRYVEMYKAEKLVYRGIKYIHRIDVVFVTMSKGIMAQCKISSDSTRQIQIDPYIWYTELSEIDRQILVFHEMGHCDLNLDHMSNIGIMGPQTMNDILYLTDKDLYLRQLFKVK